MKNTISIDTLNGCECTLVSSVDDKTARLFLNIICDPSLNPQLWLSTRLNQVKLTTTPCLVELTEAEIKGTATLDFWIEDENHVGDKFYIKQTDKLNETLYVNQIDNFNYELKYKSTLSGDFVTTGQLDNALEDVLYKAGQGESVELEGDMIEYALKSELNEVKSNVNALNSNLALKEYDVALRSNVSNAGLKTATRSGKLAVLSMLVTTTVAISGWTVIGVLPEGVRPTNIFYGVGFVQYTNACGVAISTDGQISVQPISSVPIGYNIFINFSYPVA